MDNKGSYWERNWEKSLSCVWILWILGIILLHVKPLALLLQVVLLFCFQTKNSPNKQHFSQINNLSFFHIQLPTEAAAGSWFDMGFTLNQ